MFHRVSQAASIASALAVPMPHRSADDLGNDPPVYDHVVQEEGEGALSQSGLVDEGEDVHMSIEVAQVNGRCGVMRRFGRITDI